MILCALGPVTAYRMHAPRWAVMPTSGAGAAAHGGRANRPGTPALYLSLEAGTAVGEYRQLSSLVPPGTLVGYTVHVDPVVDFRAGYDPAGWDALWEEFYCPWREL
jgi:RES domain-containing protein